MLFFMSKKSTFQKYKVAKTLEFWAVHIFVGWTKTFLDMSQKANFRKKKLFLGSVQNYLDQNKIF